MHKIIKIIWPIFLACEIFGAIDSTSADDDMKVAFPKKLHDELQKHEDLKKKFNDLDSEYDIIMAYAYNQSGYNHRNYYSIELGYINVYNIYKDIDEDIGGDSDLKTKIR